jgi:phytoene dehydrogenase-like protein
MLDTLIIGAGIAGLTVAEELARRGVNVIVLERYPNIGGRIVTNREVPQYEIGAGRIFANHHRVHGLIRRFKLHTYDISDQYIWRSIRSPDVPVPNEIGRFMSEVVVPALSSLPTDVLATHTVGELLSPRAREALVQYPYRAEVELLRSDAAVAAFENEMATFKGFTGIVEGMDALTTMLANACRSAGAKILTRHRVEDIVKNRDGSFTVVGNAGKKIPIFR